MPKKADTPTTESQANPLEPHEDAIRQRAYEISKSEDAGSADENWDRAERELASGN